MKTSEEGVSSCDHAELGAGELAFKQPVAEVDGQVNLVRPLDLVEMLVLVDIDCDKFVADFRCVLGSVDKAELLVVDGFSQLRLLVQINVLALEAFVPSDLVQALTEENHER